MRCRYCLPASRNYTLVQITPTSSTEVKTLTLDAGGYHDFEISSRESVIVRSSKPVLLAQLCKSFNADTTRNSDPFMTLITPTSQISNYYVYSTPELDRYEHYVNVFIDISQLEGIRLDGRALRSADFISGWRGAGLNYAVAKLMMAPGVHVLTHVSHVRFGATAYGLKRQESYGFPLGFYARDFREDFPPKDTTTQIRTTTREVYARTTFETTPVWTRARSTYDTTVNWNDTGAARTVDSVPIKTTFGTGAVTMKTSTTMVSYPREQDGVTNLTSHWDSSDSKGNVSSSENATISIQRNTTITPALDNSTVFLTWDIPTTAAPVRTDELLDHMERIATHVTSDRTFDPRNIAISKNYTDNPPATTTTLTVINNTTVFLQDESTRSSSHLSDTSAAETVTIGSGIATPEIYNDSPSPSNTVSTLAHNHTPRHAVSRLESVTVTTNNINSAFIDTATISRIHIESSDSVRVTTEAMTSQENTTHNDGIADEHAASATLSILTELITSNGNSNTLKHTTTHARQSEPLNVTMSFSEEAARVNNSDILGTNGLSTTSSMTQIGLDMKHITHSTFHVNTASGGSTELPYMNYNGTATNGINVTETHRQNSTHAAPSNLPERNTTHTSAPNISDTNTTHTSGLNVSQSVAVSTHLENKTTTLGMLAATNNSWNNETQANATIPAANPDMYHSNTTEQWIGDHIDNTEIVNENEMLAKEANLTAVPTSIDADTTPSSITTILIAKETPDESRVNATTMSPSIVPYFESPLDNASSEENISSHDSTPSTSIELTSINPIEDVTSSIQTEEVTDSNLNFTLEYFKKTSRSASVYTESYQRQLIETTPVSHDLNTVGESTATPFVSSFPNNNDTSSTSFVKSNDMIFTTGSSKTMPKTTAFSTVDATTERNVTTPLNNRAATIEIPSVVAETSKNALGTSPESTTTAEQSNITSATTDGEMTNDPDHSSELGSTYPSATTLAEGMLVNNNAQSPTVNAINLFTAIASSNRRNRNTLTTPNSVVTPIAQEMSAKKDDIKLMATIIVATLFGLPLLVICGCLCYGLCCGICRKHRRGACCGCAKRRRRNSRIRPTSQWSSSSQRSATGSASSSRRSSTVYIDPSVLESKGLVSQPPRKRKLDFLNFYQKPSCSNWVEVIDEQADDNSRRRDHRSARSAKDIRGKVKGNGKRRMSSYERNRKVGPTLDTRPPLPRTTMNSRMQSYIVRN